MSLIYNNGYILSKEKVRKYDVDYVFYIIKYCKVMTYKKNKEVIKLMAIPGVLFKPNHSDLAVAIKTYEGVITKIADHFGVWRGTMAKYLKDDPVLFALLEEAREQYIEKAIDRAEQTVVHLTTRTEDEPAVALKASQYFLNNQGRKRSYNHPEVEAMNKALGLLDRAKDIKVLPKIDDTNTP